MNISSRENPILVLNPGGQYAKKLDTLIRETGYRTEFVMMAVSRLTVEEVKAKYSAIIIAWSGSSVTQETSPKPSFDIFATELPILGICYGLQLINHLAGGKVASVGNREDGIDTVTIDRTPRIFRYLQKQQQVLITHGDSITEIAPWFRQIATSSSGIIAGVSNNKMKAYGVQFHPESDETTNGLQMIKNFLTQYHIDADFTPWDKKELALKEIQEKVGKKKVLVYASGGVDSTVLVSLLREALPPEQIIAVHIDHGFMRLGEREEVKEAFEKLWIPLHIEDAKEHFYNATTIIDGVRTLPLHQVKDPEIKRKIIGDAFIQMKSIIESKLSLDPKDVILAQGTLWTDIVESREGIKTHHNDSPLVHELRQLWNVIEPLSEFHKPEVRELGEELGIPTSMVWRHPFPGPGLAIRFLCSTGELSPLEIEQFSRVFQKFWEVISSLQKELPLWTQAILTPVKTTGVQGDARSYKYMCVLKIPQNEIVKPETFAHISKLITDALSIPLLDQNGEQVYQTIKSKKNWASDTKLSLSDGVNRVVLDITNTPINQRTISLTSSYICDDTIEQLRKADAIVNKILLKYNLMRKINQVPVVSFPLDFEGKEGKRSILIRTLITQDFLTGTVALPWGKDMTWSILQEISDAIMAHVPGISKVLYDITWKPPATTECE